MILHLLEDYYGKFTIYTYFKTIIIKYNKETYDSIIGFLFLLDVILYFGKYKIIYR